MQIQGFELTKVFASPEGARKRASKPHPRRRSKASSAAIPADSLQASPRTSATRARHPAVSEGLHDGPATATCLVPPARPSTGALSPSQSLASADRASFAAPSPTTAPPEQAALPIGLEAESTDIRSRGEGEELHLRPVVHQCDIQTHASSELSPLPVWGGRRQRPGVTAAVDAQCAAPASTGSAHLAERLSSQAATAGRTTASLTAAHIAHAAADDMLAAFANEDEDAASEASSAPSSQDSTDASFADAEAGAASPADPVSFCPRTEASMRDASVSVASMLDTPMHAGSAPAAAADEHAMTPAAPRSTTDNAEPRMPLSAAAASGISSLSSAESLPMPSADSASAGRPSRAVRGVPRGWRQTEYAQQLHGWEPGRGLAASTSRNGEVVSGGRRVTRSMARPTYAPALAVRASRRHKSAADELSDGAGSDSTADNESSSAGSYGRSTTEASLSDSDSDDGITDDTAEASAAADSQPSELAASGDEYSEDEVSSSEVGADEDDAAEVEVIAGADALAANSPGSALPEEPSEVELEHPPLPAQAAAGHSDQLGGSEQVERNAGPSTGVARPAPLSTMAPSQHSSRAASQPLHLPQAASPQLSMSPKHVPLHLSPAAQPHKSAGAVRTLLRHSPVAPTHEDASPARAPKQISPQEAASCARRSLHSTSPTQAGAGVAHALPPPSLAAPPREVAEAAHASLQIPPAVLLPEGSEPAPMSRLALASPARDVTGTLKTSLQPPSTAPPQENADAARKLAQLKPAASLGGTAGAARASPELSPELLSVEGAILLRASPHVPPAPPTKGAADDACASWVAPEAAQLEAAADAARPSLQLTPVASLQAAADAAEPSSRISAVAPLQHAAYDAREPLQPTLAAPEAAGAATPSPQSHPLAEANHSQPSAAPSPAGTSPSSSVRSGEAAQEQHAAAHEEQDHTALRQLSQIPSNVQTGHEDRRAAQSQARVVSPAVALEVRGCTPVSEARRTQETPPLTPPSATLPAAARQVSQPPSSARSNASSAFGTPLSRASDASAPCSAQVASAPPPRDKSAVAAPQEAGRSPSAQPIRSSGESESAAVSGSRRQSCPSRTPPAPSAGAAANAHADWKRRRARITSRISNVPSLSQRDWHRRTSAAQGAGLPSAMRAFNQPTSLRSSAMLPSHTQRSAARPATLPRPLQPPLSARPPMPPSHASGRTQTGGARASGTSGAMSCPREAIHELLLPQEEDVQNGEDDFTVLLQRTGPLPPMAEASSEEAALDDGQEQPAVLAADGTADAQHSEEECMDDAAQSPTMSEASYFDALDIEAEADDASPMAKLLRACGQVCPRQ